MFKEYDSNPLTARNHAKGSISETFPLHHNLWLEPYLHHVKKESHNKINLQHKSQNSGGCMSKTFDQGQGSAICLENEEQ